jgi:hypothetical protein
MKFPTLSATARSFSAAQPPSSSSSELTAEKKAGGKKKQGRKAKGNFGSEILQGKGTKAAPQIHHVTTHLSQRLRSAQIPTRGE